MTTSPTRYLLTILLALVVGGVGGRLLGGAGKTPHPGATPRRDVDKHAYPISVILIRVDQGVSPLKAARLADRVYQELLDGKSFEELARAHSQDPNAADGGFMGFYPPWDESTFSGAVQVLAPGTVSAPMRARDGFQIIKRHTFEEGRALERRYRIPAHGVFVPWAGIQGVETSRTRSEARVEADRIRKGLDAGTLTLDQAAELHTPEKQRRPGAFLGMLGNRPATRTSYEALSEASPGDIVGPILTPQGWAVLKRGRYLRALMRHILVQHVRSEDRDLRISRSRDEARALAQKALDEALADRSKWSQIVERYSDDATSRMVGGTLGVLGPGRIPPGFESFVYEQPPGTIHPEVVESPLGFHVVWKVL